MENQSDSRKNQTDSAQLASLMSLDQAERPNWQADELSAILQHQLKAPLMLDLRLPAPAPAGLDTFADLLHHSHPPVDLLEQTQQFAKNSARHPDSPLPREIATVLYYASIIVARLRCGRKITQLNDDALRRGLESLIAQPWVDEATRRLFREGLMALK